ncbi:MAG: hypothetical protein LBB91_01205 [Clostridiales bacterium]|jgi:hypothetical protein|nr:hypothetical protein [Clostridiales bacterium]
MVKRVIVTVLMCLLLIGITPLLGLAFPGSVFTLPGKTITLNDKMLAELNILEDDILTHETSKADLWRELDKESGEYPELVARDPVFWLNVITIGSVVEFPDTEADSELATAALEVWAFEPYTVDTGSAMLYWQIIQHTAAVTDYEVFLNYDDGPFYSIISEHDDDGFDTLFRGCLISNLSLDGDYSYYITITDINNNSASSEIFPFGAPIEAAAAPGVTTKAATNVLSKQAQLNGSITGNNGSAITDKGFKLKLRI